MPCSAAQVGLVSPWEVEKSTEKLTVSSRPSPEGLAKRLCLSAERLSSWAVSRGRNEQTWQYFPGKSDVPADSNLSAAHWAVRHICVLAPDPDKMSLLSAEFSPDSSSLSAGFVVFLMKKKKNRKSCFFLMKFLVQDQKISNCFIDLFCFVLLLKH